MRERATPYAYINLHHTAGHEANTQRVREIHMGNNGWGDIGYNAVIEPNGTVGIGRDTKWCGAHNPGMSPDGVHSMNDVAFAVSHIGDFMRDTMGEAQFKASVKFVAQKMKEFGLVPSKRTIRRHKDDYATDCPGDNFPYDRYVSEVVRLMRGGSTMPKIAILKYSTEDDWAAKDIDAKLGGVATYVRQGANKVIPAEAMGSDKLIVIGGATTGHRNEVLLSGDTKYDTALAVGNFLKK